MFILYDLIFLVFTLISLPIYLVKGKFHRGFMRRLGFIPDGLKLDNPIWIHAVSVGEMMAIRGLVNALRALYPDKKLVISTVTPTGNKIAVSTAGKNDFVTYLPLDLSFIARHVIRKINPSLFIIAETEIWPNLINSLHSQGVPIITVNGRLSDSSFKGYAIIKYLIRGVLSKVNLFCMQTESDAQRLASLGVDPEKIKVTGNMKFDQLAASSSASQRSRLGLNADERLIVAGSTHPKEEDLILKSYKELLMQLPSAKLLIAPRHPSRSKEVSGIISSYGFSPVRISQLSSQCMPCLNKPVFLLDTVGELVSFYSSADAVFVGGSLVRKGGHNILEPASAGKPVIFGQHMFNFRDIAKMFLDNDAAIMVRDQEELTAAISGLLKNTSLVARLVTNAKEIIINNQGATSKNIEAIKSVYKYK